MVNEEDGYLGQLMATDYGGVARVSLLSLNPMYLDVWVRLSAITLDGFNTVLVYVSSDDYNWHFVGSGYITSYTLTWYNFGKPADIYEYNYVLVVAYCLDGESNTWSQVNVDAVTCGAWTG